MSVGRRLAVLALPALFALGGCAVTTSSLRLRGKPLDAAVTVDDQYLGTLAYVIVHGVAMPPGKHRVTVQKAGYFPWDRLVESHGTTGERIQLDVEMTPIPD